MSKEINKNEQIKLNPYRLKLKAYDEERSLVRIKLAKRIKLEKNDGRSYTTQSFILNKNDLYEICPILDGRGKEYDLSKGGVFNYDPIKLSYLVGKWLKKIHSKQVKISTKESKEKNSIDSLINPDNIDFDTLSDSTGTAMEYLVDD